MLSGTPYVPDVRFSNNQHDVINGEPPAHEALYRSYTVLQGRKRVIIQGKGGVSHHGDVCFASQGELHFY